MLNGYEATLPIWGLTFARCVGVALLVPPAGIAYVPVSLRIAAAAVLAVPLSIVAAEHAAGAFSITIYSISVLRNAAIGLVIGALVAAVLYAAMMASTYIDTVAGWPADGAAGSGAGRRPLLYLLTCVLFVLGDGHLAVLRALVASFAIVAPTPDAVTQLGQDALVLAPARMFAASLAIALPALLAAVVGRAMLAIAERVGREYTDSGIAVISAPVIVITALVAALPAIAYVVLHQFQIVMGQIDALLG